MLVLEVVCGSEFDYCRGGGVGGDWWWWCRKWWCLWPLVMMGRPDVWWGKILSCVESPVVSSGFGVDGSDVDGRR